MNIIAIAYVVALVAGAIAGAALLLTTVVLAAFHQTRAVAIATFIGAAIGAVAVTGAFVALTLAVSGTLRYIGSEMWAIWALIGAAVGGLPTFLVSGAAKAVVTWVQSRKAHVESQHRSVSALEKFE